MTQKEMQNTSKFISLILRHKPEAINIKLDNHGWANTTELIQGLCKAGHNINMKNLEEIVAQDEKQRYSFNKDKSQIRANQGHSIQVDVELQEKTPPIVLYHGTSVKYLDKILKEGLKPMSRLYVHLSSDKNTALNVGKRHGKPVIITIDTELMVKNGLKFYISENKVWLTQRVKPEYFKSIECN